MRTAGGRWRLAQTFFAGVALAIVAVGSLPRSYNRDFSQDYLGARAIRDGLDPYTPLPELAAHYFPVRMTSLPTSTGHPPTVLALSVPMSLLPYEIVYPLALAANMLLLLIVGPAGLVRYYTEIVPQVSGRYVGIAMNASPYGALLWLLGEASDVEPILKVPGLAGLLAALVAVLGVVALIRLSPQGAPLAAMVTLPAAWSYQIVLGLPEIVRLLKLPRRGQGILAAAVAASCPAPLISWAALLVLTVTGLSGDRTPPITGFIGGVQTAGILALLVLSLRAESAPPSSPSARPGAAPPEQVGS